MITQEIPQEGYIRDPLLIQKEIKEVIDKPFYPTKSEWAAGNKEQIISRAATTSGVATVYTVPNNKFLYITSANLSWTGEAAAGSITSASLYIDDGSGSNNKIFLDIPAKFGGDLNVVSVSQSFPMPLRVSPGSTIKVTGGDATGTSDGRGSIQGYLDDQ